MKKTLIALFILIGFISYSQDFQKIEIENIDAKQLAFSKNFVSDFFESHFDGDHFVFNTDNASDAMINAFTPLMQKNVYNHWINTYGKIESTEFTEAWIDNNSGIKVYRFKSRFGEYNINEIRVVLRPNSKITGFFVKPWQEEMR